MTHPTAPSPEKPDPVEISVVVPVFNSGSLLELADRIEASLAAAARPYEIIFVDDSSTDPAVWPLLERLARERPRVRAIQLTRNFGQQAATLCGLAEAQGRHMITMDDDLQHRPEDIARFLKCGDWDIVIGQFDKKEHGLFRRLASRLKGVFDRIVIGTPKSIQLSSFRMLSRTVVDGILAIRTPHPFIPAMMFHVSRSVTGVRVRHLPRKAGGSGYTLSKLIGLFSNLLINNSALILRLVGHIGMLLALLSFSLTGVVIYKKLVLGVAVRGWASLMAAVLMVGGLLLFGLGVIGEYLIRIIEASEARPTYFVRRRIGRSEVLSQPDRGSAGGPGAQPSGRD